jgi:hypothetical protein
VVAAPTTVKKSKGFTATGGLSAGKAISTAWSGKPKSPLLSKSLGGKPNPIRSALAMRLKSERSRLRANKPVIASKGVYDRKDKSIAKSRGTNIVKNAGVGKLTPSFVRSKTPVKGGVTFKGVHYAPGSIAPGTKFSRVKVSMKGGKPVARYLERGLIK